MGYAYFLSELPSTAFLCVRSDTTMGPTCVRAANALVCIYTGSSVDFCILVGMYLK